MPCVYALRYLKTKKYIPIHLPNNSAADLSHVEYLVCVLLRPCCAMPR